MAYLTTTQAERHIKDKLKLILETQLPFMIAVENQSLSSNPDYQIKAPYEIIVGTNIITLNAVSNAIDYGPVVCAWLGASQTTSYDGVAARNIQANLNVAVYESFDLINGTYTSERAQRLLSVVKECINKFIRDPHGNVNGPACVYQCDIVNDTVNSPTSLGGSMYSYSVEAVLKLYYRVCYSEIPTYTNTTTIGLLPYVQSNALTILPLSGTWFNATDESVQWACETRGYATSQVTGTLATGTTGIRFDNVPTGSLGAGSMLHVTIPQGSSAQTITIPVTGSSISGSFSPAVNWQVGNLSYVQCLIIDGVTNVPYPYSAVVITP